MNNNLVYNTYNNTRRINPSQPHNKTKRIDVSEPKKEVYPDQLNITIRTSIPGYQKIQYTPSMTIKDTKEKSVMFNPMVKLNKSIVDKIPKEYRAKQFMNIKLFNSLLIMNNEQPVNSLIVATRRGYVDNNIKITLDALFPVGSVIYIGDSPYSIGDVQWTSGDWKINVKQKEEIIDPRQIEDPFLRSQVINNEIKEGIKQINNLPRSVVAGNNYNGPQLVQEKNETIKNVDEEKKVEEKERLEKERLEKERLEKERLEKERLEKVRLEKERLEKERLEKERLEKERLITNPLNNLTRKPVPQNNLLLKNETPDELPESPKVEEISTAEAKLYDGYKYDLQIDNNATDFFINFFKTTLFFNLVNTIYKNFNIQMKYVIRLFYFATTGYHINSDKGITKTYYDNLCSNVAILSPPRDGNCFFKAVAEGINIHNSNNPNDRIIHGIYGKTQLFTIAILRDLVYDYYTEIDEDAKKTIYDVAKYDKYIKDGISMEQYIKSNSYWGDQLSFDAVCRKLKICVIPIKRNDKRMEMLLMTPNEMIKPNCSENVMFLYYNKSHYELIKFSYKVDERVKIDRNGSGKITERNFKPFTIFSKNGIVPPIHILFLLYATTYTGQKEEYKQHFVLYKDIMTNIDIAVKRIMVLKNTDMTKVHFINNFKRIFPNKFLISPMTGGDIPININTSKIAYEITIDMELHAGDHLSPEQIKQSACNNKYNAIRRAFAEFTGRPYVIPPVYPASSKKGGNKTRKLRN